MVFDIEEELLSDPLLLKTPIVRNENWLPLVINQMFGKNGN